MNFFFGLNNNNFKSEIQIPCFKNKEPQINLSHLKIFKISIMNNLWKFEKINLEKKDNFFILKDEEIDNSSSYFLSPETNEIKFNSSKLDDYDSFTDTHPAFRANLKIKYKSYGFSSYQSEYPASMIFKQGSILSSIHSLANKDADKNYLMFKNIYHLPTHENSDAFFIDIKKRKIIEKFSIKSNFTNFIEINKSIIKPEIYFFTKSCLGIPVYISEQFGHLSMEHTHPPKSNFLSKNRYDKVSNLKLRINEIIS